MTLCTNPVDDLDSIEGHLRSANTQDSSDCVKKLICELHSSKGEEPLAWDEELIRHAVDNRQVHRSCDRYVYFRHVSYACILLNSRIDYSSPFVQFQLAADLGQKQPEQCSVVFSRFPNNY